MADGKSYLQTCGESHFVLQKGVIACKMDAIIVTELDVPILAGTPFLRKNQVTLDFANQTIKLKGQEFPAYPTVGVREGGSAGVKRVETILRAEITSILLPQESLRFDLPPSLQGENFIAVEPHDYDSFPTQTTSWPEPRLVPNTEGHVLIINDTSEPIVIPKHCHVAAVRTVIDEPLPPVLETDTNNTDVLSNSSAHSAAVSLDPDNMLSLIERESFDNLHLVYDGVFNPSIGRYNDHSGRIRASISMGPVEPPHTKVYFPSYDEKKLRIMQQKCDDLEAMGVLARPEDVGVQVEYVSPSFLVARPNGGDPRLVTSFQGIAAYAKKPPSRSHKPKAILHFLSRFKYIIQSDQTKQFFHLPLTKKSMRYCGIQTPYKGIRVYTRAAMGLPGSSEHLDELMSRVLGSLIAKGNVCRIHDDLFVGAQTIPELLEIWEDVLQRFQDNNLRLSAKKTVISPRSTIVLGWLWRSGTISISPHKLNPLASCDLPTTVKSLRSWIGSVKHLNPCIERLAVSLSPLENMVAGKESRNHLTWTEDTKSAFSAAQALLGNAKTITIPVPNDQLVITTDGASHNNGIGAVLHVFRDGKTMLGGYFSMKLRSNHVRWLPCEIEALAIASAVEHWSLDITSSDFPTQILTDSKPCVQAFQRLQRGQFSSSARVSSFLSTLSRYRVTLQHISGNMNQTADFLSRNPAECEERHCQVCSFAHNDVSIRSLTVRDVEEGRSRMPFLTPAAWKVTQQDCPNLRRVFSQFKQGSVPRIKDTNCREVKHYLSIATINRDGVLVVRRNPAFKPNQELVVVPQRVLPGLVTALHIRFSHPKRTQLEKIFNRYFYSTGSAGVIRKATEQCAQCSALATLPPETPEFTTSEPPTAPGYRFASDVMRRERQYVLVTRDAFSAYTTATLIPKENKDSFRNGLLETTASLRAGGRPVVIRVDGASSLQSLQNDQTLKEYGIILEIGRLKCKNKNPIAEKAIQELEVEIRKRFPSGGQLTPTQLSETVHILNTRQRQHGLSAREIVFQRDYISGEKLNVNDDQLKNELFEARKANHGPSARSKVPPRKNRAIPATFQVGDLVYIKSEGSKHLARDQYVICKIDCASDYIHIRKLINNQFRSKSYQVRPCEIFKLPTNYQMYSDDYDSDSSSNSDSSESVITQNHDNADGNLFEEPSDLDDNDDTNERHLIPETILTDRRIERSNHLRPRAVLNLPKKFDDYVLSHDLSDDSDVG